MTDEAKALVQRLEEWALTLLAACEGGDLGTDEPAAIMYQAADLIETQAREIERLRAVLDNIAHESSDTWARRDACVALGIDWPEARRQP